MKIILGASTREFGKLSDELDLDNRIIERQVEHILNYKGRIFFPRRLSNVISESDKKFLKYDSSQLRFTFDKETGNLDLNNAMVTLFFNRSKHMQINNSSFSMEATATELCLDIINHFNTEKQVWKIDRARSKGQIELYSSTGKLYLRSNQLPDIFSFLEEQAPVVEEPRNERYY